MGWASEMQIELHNEAMENDEDYRQHYLAEMEREESYFAFVMGIDETAIDWFPEYKLSFDGYEENKYEQ